jgi:integrase
LPEPLTPTAIRAIKPPASGRLDIPDGACAGLCLRVSAHHTWTWTLRMRLPTGLRRFVLGEFTDKQGLAWARREAERVRQQVRREGRDPLRERKQAAIVAQRQAERDRLTLGVLVEDWERLHLSSRKPRYAAEAVRALHTAFHAQWGKPVETLDKATVVRVLDGLARPLDAPKRRRGIAGDGSAIAGRTAAYGRACFAWAMKRDVVAGNPFAALPAAKSAKAGQARERVLSNDELTAIWKAAEGMEPPFGPLVRLLILTGQRREEVAGMAWSELSPDLSTWTIPATRAKNGRPHIVPLSAAAQEIVTACKPKLDGGGPSFGAALRGLVLPGARGTAFAGWSKSKAQLDADADVTGWRLHDIRRTLATGLQRLGVRLEVTEAVLNHISGTRAGIVGVYQRHDWAAEKRAALDAWAAHVAAAVRGAAEPGNVVAIRLA